MVADRRPASFGRWTDVELDFVWAQYATAVERAGGAPVVVPVAECYERGPELALDVVDGLLLTGGRDLDALAYACHQHPENDEPDAARDRVERAIAAVALERDLPILGVCRGMQLLNVIHGGGIDQHLADPDGLHRGRLGSFVRHDVTAMPDTKLGFILGPGESAVRSHHHQGVDPVAEGFVVSARSSDGLIEAMEAVDRDFCLGVLWHPEAHLAGGGLAIYRALVAAATARRAAGVAA